MKEYTKYQKTVRNSLLWIIIFVTGMVVFTFTDLPIAKAVYALNNPYGKFFEILGIVPTSLAGIFFSISNLKTLRIAYNRKLAVIVSFLSIFAFAGFNLLSLYYLDSRFCVPMVLVDIVIIRISVMANDYICSHATSVELRKIMLVALFSTLVAVLGQTIIKYGFNRPRFITLTNPDVQFTYWFVHHPIAHDSSFPSGHAAQAALTFVLVLFKRFLPKLRTRKWDIILYSIAIFVTVSTMFARMLLGLHYASDVWAGCFLTLFTISASVRYVDKLYN